MTETMRDYHNRPLPAPDMWKWLIAVAGIVSVIGLLSWTAQKDQRYREELAAEDSAAIAAGLLPADLARLEVNLNDCPPQTEGMTDIVVFVISTKADRGPAITSCTRFAERPYIVPSRKPRTEAP